jgi:YesN/AraC family two-component response regulator
VRIEAAKKELESGQASINEVMYQLGYSDGKTFRDLFRKITGVAPIEYKNKFARINGPR